MKNKKTLFIVIGLAAAVLFSGGIAIALLLDRRDNPPADDTAISQGESSENPEDGENPEGEGEGETSEGEEGEGEEGEGAQESEENASSQIDTPGESSSQPESEAGTPAQGGGVSFPSLASSQPASTQNLVINTSGTNGTVETCRNLYIETTPVTLKNKTVTGDLVIDAAAGNGDITLENIAVTGNIFVSGGGKVTLKNVTAKGMVADKATGTQTIALSGQTRIPDMWVKGDVTLDESGLDGATGVNNVYSQAGGRANNELTLKDANLDLVSTSTPTNVTVPTNSSVRKVSAGAQTHLGGSGSVRELAVASDSVTYETKPSTVTTTGSYTASLSAGGIGSNDYGSPTASDPNQYPSGPLTTPTGLEIYVIDNSIYGSFTGDKNAKEGYTVTPIIDGKRQRDIQVTGAGTGTPPKQSDIFLIDAANSLRGKKVSFEVYANPVPKKYSKSGTARSDTHTVYETAEMQASSLNISRNTRSNEYTVNWDQVEFVTSGNNVMRPSNTMYYVDYTVKESGGGVVYQATGRTSTNKSSYKIPVMPSAMGNGSSIDVTVYAEVDTDRYPCVVGSELQVLGSFKLGDLPAPTGLSAELPSSGYGLKTSWAAVDDAEGYTVTALINKADGSTKEVSQSTTGTSCDFTGLVTPAEAADVTSLSFKVAANAPASSIYSGSQPATMAGSLPVHNKLAVPAQSSMKIDLLTHPVGAVTTAFDATWPAIKHAAGYELYATHYDKNGEVNFSSLNNVLVSDTGKTEYTNTFADQVSSGGGGLSPTEGITFTVKTKAHENSWFVDSDEQESSLSPTAIYLDAPNRADMEIILSTANKETFTARWGEVKNAWGYRVIPIYSGQAWLQYEVVLSPGSGADGPKATEYTFTNLGQGPEGLVTSIAFRVYALSAPGTWYSNSDLTDSATVQVNQPMPTPKNVTIELADQNTKAVIRWDTVENAAKYMLTYYVENAPGSLDDQTVEIQFTGSPRTEYTITNLDPDLIRSLSVQVCTIAKIDSWNDDSPLSTIVKKTINPTKLATPVLPYLTRDASGNLKVTWSAGSTHNLSKDQFRVWIDLPAGDTPTAFNAAGPTPATSSEITIPAASTGLRTHNIMIQAVPQMVEHNRTASDVLNFYILNVGGLTATPQGIVFPALTGENAFASDPVVEVTSYVVIPPSQNTRTFAFAYDGTVDTTLVLHGTQYTDWAGLSGQMHFELKTRSGKIYYTETKDK